MVCEDFLRKFGADVNAAFSWSPSAALQNGKTLLVKALCSLQRWPHNRPMRFLVLLASLLASPWSVGKTFAKKPSPQEEESGVRVLSGIR